MIQYLSGVGPCSLAASVRSVIVRAVTSDHAEGLQHHVLPKDNGEGVLTIVREAAVLPPLSDEHND